MKNDNQQPHGLLKDFQDYERYYRGLENPDQREPEPALDPDELEDAEDPRSWIANRLRSVDD